MGSERKDRLVRYYGPAERRAHRRAWWRNAGLLLAGFVVLTLLDVPLVYLFYIEDREPLQNSDLYRLVRVVGTLWLWLLVMWIVRRHDRVWDRAGSLFFAPIIAGLSCEGLKLVIARERPVLDTETLRSGWYAFRPLFSGFSDASNLGFPSSHAAVAFAGCMCLAAWMPRAKWIFIGLAVSCGVARMLIGAHYATDIYVGALIGWGWARFFEPVERPRRYG
ncbi:MAG: phosphatase PAP2 family protein [Phycisphaerales bacterium]|nr:phosphatase PAP2 family protein [Planctomycetota bacterium]MCH8508130.1 phosphatase PAP2 family protein [Phycisphaerales bacterium]